MPNMMSFTPRHRRSAAYAAAVADRQRAALGDGDDTGGAADVERLGRAGGDHPVQGRVADELACRAAGQRPQPVQQRRRRTLPPFQRRRLDHDGDVRADPTYDRRPPGVQREADNGDQRVGPPLLR